MRNLEKKFTCDNKVTRMKGCIGGSLFEASADQKIYFQNIPSKELLLLLRSYYSSVIKFLI